MFLRYRAPTPAPELSNIAVLRCPLMTTRIVVELRAMLTPPYQVNAIMELQEYSAFSDSLQVKNPSYPVLVEKWRR